MQVAAKILWGQDSHDSSHACRWQQKYFEAEAALTVVMSAGGSRNTLEAKTAMTDVMHPGGSRNTLRLRQP